MSAPVTASLPHGPDATHQRLPILPLDVLLLIVERVPPRARLHTMSLVCKRWRQAAVSTLSELSITPSVLADLGSPRSSPLRMDHFTRVTKLAIHGSCLGQLILPPSLTSLRLFTHSHEQCPMAGLATNLPALSALTELRVPIWRGCEHVLPILRKVQPTLASLDLAAQLEDNECNTWLPGSEAINALTFPRLTRLVAAHVGVLITLSRLLPNHSTQDQRQGRSQYLLQLLLSVAAHAEQLHLRQTHAPLAQRQGAHSSVCALDGAAVP